MFAFEMVAKGSYGDRRQEIVFIGLGMTDEATLGSISSALEACLLTDDEMRLYDQGREVWVYFDKCRPCCH